ncbi:MAG TPA: SGNH/GDSL hydrolase family protein [Gaiellaceae bacterium]
MPSLRLVRALGGLTGLCCLLSACSTPTSAPTKTAAPPHRGVVTVVALGDSVPRGTNCSCTPYPELSADGLASASGQGATTDNDSVAGATTATVLEQLESDDTVIADLHAADVVEVEIGANDVGYSTSCGTTASCYASRVPAMRSRLRQIVDVARSLAPRKAVVVLLDYWSVWLGGKYADAKGEAYVDAAARVTDQVDDAIRSTAAESGSDYVDLRAAFKGPDYSYDETHYLSNDGDHPNAAGHQKIAVATDAVIGNAVHA